MNLLDFQQKFGTEEACLKFLEEARWGKDGKNRYCPHCGSLKTYKFKSGKLYKCGDCRKQFTAKIGTIFSDSKIPLYKWFLAIYLSSSLKKGISSIQISKYLGVTQKTAWFMLHRIRLTFASTGNDGMLEGIVEVDETYTGTGNHYKERRRGGADLAVIFGMVERGGRVRIRHVPSAGARVLQPIIAKNVKQDSTIYSDGAQVYKALPSMGYDHDSVTHSAKEYARKGVHVNTIEGLWSELHRSIYATYHFVSVKHLQQYCNESEFKYNTRELDDGGRFEAWFQRIACRLRYRELIG